MPECSPIQTCVCYGRGIQQQWCDQDGCCQVFPGRKPHQQEGSRDICPVSTASRDFLCIQTWNTKYPRFDRDWVLNFNVWFTVLARFVFNISTLQQHRWNTDVDWTSDIAETDLLDLYYLKDALKRTLWALGLDWTQLAEKRGPSYRHPLLEPIHQRVERVSKARGTFQTTSEEASFEIIDFRLFSFHASTDPS